MMFFSRTGSRHSLARSRYFMKSGCLITSSHHPAPDFRLQKFLDELALGLMVQLAVRRRNRASSGRAGRCAARTRTDRWMPVGICLKRVPRINDRNSDAGGSAADTVHRVASRRWSRLNRANVDASSRASNDTRSTRKFRCEAGSSDRSSPLSCWTVTGHAAGQCVKNIKTMRARPRRSRKLMRSPEASVMSTAASYTHQFR